MGFLVPTVAAALLALPAWYLHLVYHSYRSAKATGLPIVFNPWSPASPVAYLLSRFFHRLASRLGLGAWLRFAYYGWEVQERERPFLEMGVPAFVIVSPGRNWLYLADPGTVAAVYAAERRGEITRPAEDIDILDVFGPNITSAQGHDWQRMRRSTAASFNEMTNRVVWRETLKQGRQMLRHWLAAGADGVRSTGDDTQMLALNILLSAGFGRSYDFVSVAEDRAADKRIDAMDYREAIKVVIENAIVIIGVGPHRLPALGALSGKMAYVAKAYGMFQQYMVDMLDQGRKGDAASAKGNLLESLVSASRDDKLLSQQEVFGNMFVYTFGGHDTTAHSLAWTFVLLSIHPEVQEWMREEIREVLKGKDSDQWSYDDFARLKRTQAVQFETIRLYNPVLGVLKGPVDRPVQLSVDDGKRSFSVGRDFSIVINTNAIHTSRRHWGEDALEWRPSRFVQTDEAGRESLMVPPKGVFQPWGDGNRACPGKKFAHVEHVATMAALFHGHAVEPVRERGETTSQMTDRVRGVINDITINLTLQMKHPERAPLVWSKCP